MRLIIKFIFCFLFYCRNFIILHPLNHNTMKTITVNKTNLIHDLSVFPNFSSTGSIKGMKKLYYGADALLIKSGSYIYKVTQEVYNYYS